MSDTSLVFNLIAKDRVSGQVGKVESKFGRLKNTVKGLAGPALAFGAISMFKGIMDDTHDADTLLGITKQLIKTTGGVAHVSASQVDELARSLSDKTGIDHKVINSGENVLLTFKGVRNEVGKGNDIFDRATKAGVDMSAALNGGTVTAEGLKSANIQLGKALNDPVKGLSALQRVGVTFTAQQKKQIETMVKSGDTIGAQKIIMKEMESEFGGAAAAGTTATVRLKTKLTDLGEKVGHVLIPIIDKLANKLSDVLDYVQKNSSWLKPLVLALTGLVSVIWLIVKATKAWTAIQKALDIVMDADPIFLIIAGIVLLVIAIVYIATKTHWFQNIWGAVWGFVKRIFHTVTSWIKGRISWLVSGFQMLYNKVKGFFTGIGSWITSKIRAALNWVAGKVAWLLGRFSAFNSRVIHIASSIGSSIRSRLGSAINWVHGKVNSFVGFMSGLPGRIGRAVSGAFNGLKSAFRSAINWVIGRWNSLHFSLPSFSVLGHKFGGGTIGVPHIPGLAKGGIATSAGTALVGENGPEFISMPRGAAVSPLPKGGGGYADTRPMELHIRIGDKELGVLLVDPLKKVVKSRGGNVQAVFG